MSSTILFASNYQTHAMDQREPFGAVLRRIRVAAGLTREMLAERAGLGARTISDLERGISRNPRADTLALLLDALQLSPENRAELEASAIPAVQIALATIPTNLPAPLTTFVGRTQELTTIGSMLQRDDRRLITLTGPGGVGKTRLASEMGREARQTFPDGVFTVALAPVSSEEGAIQAIYRSLAIEPAESPGLPQICASIAAKRLLLILDNCEHLPSAATIALELFRGTSRLTLLATSRTPLRVSGEQEFPVQPLPVPGLADANQVTRIAGNPSIHLFVDRASHARPDFVLTSENAAAVAAICKRLDGLPLALELAAARIRVLPPQMLMDRLTDATSDASLHLLTGGPVDLPARHQTLHDTIAWSHNLLNERERKLFRRLPVFVGGCTVDAVEAICGNEPHPGANESSPESHRSSDVLINLISLVEQSLVVQETNPCLDPRFTMLETIRSFAREQLDASGETNEMRERHARYYLEMVESTGAVLFATAPTLARISAEDGNLQTALRWPVQGS